MANIRIKDLTTQARHFAADDFVESDGATNASRKVSPFDAHGQFRNALAPRGGIALDGTSTARGAVTLTGQSIAADSVSAVLVLAVPTTGVAFAGIMAVGSSLTDASLVNFWYVDFGASGNDLRVIMQSNPASNYRTATITNWRTTFSGKTVMLALVRDSSALSFTIYVNGVAQTLSTNTFGGTDPTWAVSVTSTYFVFGDSATNSFKFVGKVYSAALYNLALSAADVLEIFELGGGVPERFKFGSQVDFNTGTIENGGGSRTWPTFTGATATGVTLAKTTTSASCLAGWLVPGGVKPGNQIRVKYDLTINSGATDIQVQGHTGLSSGGGGGTDLFTPVAGTGKTGIVTFSQVQATMYLIFVNATNGSAYDFTVANVSLEKLGAVVHLPLDDGLGFELQDVSTNRLHAIMTAAGVSHVVPLYGPARVRRTSSTNGNEQLFGQVCIPGQSQIVRVRARAQTNTPTVTLGTSSGGSQVVASVALSTSWKDLTIALTGGLVGSSNISLWAGSNSTDVVEWDVTWEPLSP